MKKKNKQKNERELLQEINNKLNILISPLFKKEKGKQDKKITRKNIKKLKECGLDYIEIASILDMNPGSIANELTYLKNKNGKKMIKRKVKRGKNAKKK